MFALSGLFAANQHHDPGGQGCLPGFRVWCFGTDGLSCDGEERGKMDLRWRDNRQTNHFGQPRRGVFQSPCYRGWDNAFVSQDAATMVALIYAVPVNMMNVVLPG